MKEGTGVSADKPTNERVAEVLERIADLLEADDGNPFRIGAYRDAAQTVRGTDQSVAELASESGSEALEQLPNVGEGIARVIRSYVRTGRSDMLDRLRSKIAPEDVFIQVPGVGRALAQRIVAALDISTLEELEQAAHDGRLREVEGFGPERVRMVRIGLAGLLSAAAQRRRRRSGTDDAPADRPDVDTLLGVDEAYRRKAAAGELRKIAPKRFNPEGKAWLPVLNAERDGWEFTALYSNTKRAHELDKTEDWVVLYYERDGEDGQATAVTETGGALEGKRVVRGREDECRRYYKRRDHDE